MIFSPHINSMNLYLQRLQSYLGVVNLGLCASRLMLSPLGYIASLSWTLKTMCFLGVTGSSHVLHLATKASQKQWEWDKDWERESQPSLKIAQHKEQVTKEKGRRRNCCTYHCVGWSVGWWCACTLSLHLLFSFFWNSHIIVQAWEPTHRINMGLGRLPWCFEAMAAPFGDGLGQLSALRWNIESDGLVFKMQQMEMKIVEGVGGGDRMTGFRNHRLYHFKLEEENFIFESQCKKLPACRKLAYQGEEKWELFSLVLFSMCWGVLEF